VSSGGLFEQGSAQAAGRLIRAMC